MKSIIVKDLLADLISIPSPFFYEEKISEFLEGILNDMGFTTTRQQVRRSALIDGHPREFTHFNVLGEKGEGERSFLLYGHIDTVPVVNAWKEMGLDPFKPLFRDGKIYGLGACDMKGGVAAILKAIEDIEPQDYRIKICFGVDEENESVGAYVLVNSDFIKDCVGCIVPEVGSGAAKQNSRNILTGRHGRNRVGILVRGHAAHAATPEYIVNPIEYALEAINEAKKIDFGDDPDMPPGNISIAGIQSAGGGLSSPEECVIWFDNLYLPPLNTLDIFRQYIEICEKLNKKYAGVAIGKMGSKRVAPPRFSVIDLCNLSDPNKKKFTPRATPFMEPWKIDRDHPLVKCASDVIKNITGEEPVLTCGKSNADENYIGPLVPTIGIPPIGGGEHQGGEWVDPESVEKAAGIMRGIVDNYMRITISEVSKEYF